MNDSRFLIGIAGGTCSGKTTLARRIAARYRRDSVILPMDNYYKAVDLSYEERVLINHDLPEAFDWPLLRDQLKTVLEGGKIKMPVYDFRSHKRTNMTRQVSPNKIIILEGLYALYDESIRDAMNLLVFLDSTSEERWERRLERDLAERNPNREEIARKFNKMAEPAYNQYILPTGRFADVVESDVGAAEKRVSTAIARFIESLKYG